MLCYDLDEFNFNKLKRKKKPRLKVFFSCQKWKVSISWHCQTIFQDWILLSKSLPKKAIYTRSYSIPRRHLGTQASSTPDILGVFQAMDKISRIHKQKGLKENHWWVYRKTATTSDIYRSVNENISVIKQLFFC